MKRFGLAIAAVGALAAVGCASGGVPEAVDMAPAAGSAQAPLRNAAGRAVAQASASQLGDAVRVRIEAAGLAPGTYGAHVHVAGRCDAPGFESAGPHWNPTERQHGRDNPAGQHLGDLPNLMVGTDGRGSLEFSIPAASLTGGRLPLLDGDGAALVLHAGADDYRTDPSGNSGARIACGVLA